MDGVRVLLVEDNTGDARLIREALGECGFEVDVAERLRDGLDRLEGQPVDVVLLDLSLPDSAGLGTFRTFRERCEEVPIVVLSGLDDADVAREAVGAGAQDYLVKGREDPEALRRTIEYAIERNRIVAELRELNRLKGEFVAIASHELRAPLTSLVGFAQLLRTRWGDLGEDDRRDAIARIDEGGRRLLRLVDDLLTMSRIESGMGDPCPQDVVLVESVRAVLEGLGKAGEGVRISCPPGLLVRADPTHVEQILGNLVANGLTHGEPPVEVEASREAGMVQIRVRDRGPGIPEDFVDRLFEKFTRARGAQRGGTGLGLSIVQALAAANDGEVVYEAAEPTGACFRVRLRAV